MQTNNFKLIFLLLYIVYAGHVFASQVSINSAKEPKIITLFDLEPKKIVSTNAMPKEIPTKDIVQKEIPKQTSMTKQEIKPSFTKTEPKQSVSDTKNETIGFVFASNNTGKYGLEASNVAMTYFLNKNAKFNIEFFDIELENKQNITTIFDTLKQKGIKKVIALVTNSSLWALNSYPEISKFELYLPLVNKSMMPNAKSNFVFGGIDYKKQLNFLALKASSNVVEIYDDSAISIRLHNELVALNTPNLTHIQITGKIPDYKILIASSEQIKNSSVILNTSIVKSAIVLSHLRENNIVPREILSSQLNYSPVIFNITGDEDRTNLFVVNSIGTLPRDLEELISFFGNDALFSWVNYSVVLGLEYFATGKTKLFGNTSIKGNQVDYGIKKIGFNGSRFVDL